jgi:hypothetical protein
VSCSLWSLTKGRSLVWYPPVSRFAPKFNYCDKQHSAKDIFTLFDCLALKDSEVRYIQYTSYKNRRAREKKINAFYEKWNVFLPAEVWSIKDDKTIDIIYI